MVQATAYGDSFRIQMQQKSSEDRAKKSSKSVSNAVAPEVRAAAEEQRMGEEGSELDAGPSKKRNINYFPEIYTMATVQQSKFNKDEKKFILRQALALTNLQESINVSKIEYMYKSTNMFFFIAKEPTCMVSRSLLKKIELKRCNGEVQHNRVLS